MSIRSTGECLKVLHVLADPKRLCFKTGFQYLTALSVLELALYTRQILRLTKIHRLYLGLKVCAITTWPSMFFNLKYLIYEIILI